MRAIKAVALAIATLNLWSVGPQAQVQAQESRTLGKGSVIVRLCPVKCVAVNGHGLKTGGKVTIYESKSGWVRVSDYLNRSRLAKSFGNSITKKPALWVSSSQLVGGESATSKTKTEVKPSNQSPARLKRVAIPTFRPDTKFSQSAEVPSEPIQQTPTDVETADTSGQPTKTEEITEPKSEVAETPSASQTEPVDGTRRLLTWEQLQERLAKQSEEQKRLSQLSEAEKAARAKEQAALAEEEAKQRRAAQAAKAAKAAKAAEAAEAARNAQAAEAAKAAQDEAADAAKAAKAAETAKASEAAKAAEAEQAAADAKKAKAAADATATAATDEEETKKAQAAQDAQNTVEKAEPVFKSAIADPIVLGSRPKKLTKELLDKRLSKLPGRKSKVRKDVVIALRHFAMGLLKSGECKGIAAGGPSAVPGMLYVTCTEDPTYLRQFPVKEETW